MRKMNLLMFGIGVVVLLLCACTVLPTSVSPIPTPDEPTPVSLPNVVDDSDYVTFSMLLFWEDSVTGDPGYDHRIVAEVPVASLWATGRVKDAQGNVVHEWEWDTGILPYVVNDSSGPGSGQYGDPILFVVNRAIYPADDGFTVSGKLFWRVEGEGDLACIPDSATELDADGWSVLGSFVGTQPPLYNVYMPLVVRGEW